MAERWLPAPIGRTSAGLTWPGPGPRLLAVTQSGAPTASPEEQLEAIASLGRALDGAGIEHWLFGGWAVDFWVGAVTRPHDDIDVAAWRADHDAIGAALLGSGWRHTPVADEVVGTRYSLGAAQVEFTFFVKDENRWVVVPVPDSPILVSPEPLGSAVREFQGVAARTFPLSLLRSGKETPREGAAGDKDRADREALAHVTDDR